MMITKTVDYISDRSSAHMAVLIQHITILLLVGFMTLPTCCTTYTVPKESVIQLIKEQISHLQHLNSHESEKRKDIKSHLSANVNEQYPPDLRAGNGTIYVEKTELVKEIQKQQWKEMTHSSKNINQLDSKQTDKVQSKLKTNEVINSEGGSLHAKESPQKKIGGLIHCSGWGPSCSIVKTTPKVQVQRPKLFFRPSSFLRTGNLQAHKLKGRTKLKPRKSAKLSFPQTLRQKLSAHVNHVKPIIKGQVKKHPFFISGSSWEPGNGKKRAAIPPHHMVAGSQTEMWSGEDAAKSVKKRVTWFHVDPFNRFLKPRIRTKRNTDYRDYLNPNYWAMIGTLEKRDGQYADNTAVETEVPIYGRNFDTLESLQHKRSWPRVDLYNRFLRRYYLRNGNMFS